MPTFLHLFWCIHFLTECNSSKEQMINPRLEQRTVYNIQANSVAVKLPPKGKCLLKMVFNKAFSYLISHQFQTDCNSCISFLPSSDQSCSFTNTVTVLTSAFSEAGTNISPLLLFLLSVMLSYHSRSTSSSLQTFADN